MAMEDLSDKLTPRSAAQTLQGYQDNHQIELFFQEMLSVVCTVLPEDPYEYMMNHVASNRPAPPPAESQLCGSGALWVLLRDGDPECAEHWRLRRCWLTGKGSFCISTEPATVTTEGAKVKMKAPKNTASATHPIEVGGSFRELDEVARPFAFVLATGGKEVFLAAGSEEQRDEWFNLLGHFADADRRKGPLPKSNISPRTGGTQVVDSIGPADIPMQPVKDPAKVVRPVKPSQPREQDPTRTLKPILKTKPSHFEPGKVPAIRIPRHFPNDPMEACGDSTRRSSIRFSDDVERREFSVNRAEPVPANMRAHESRRKPAMGTVKAETVLSSPHSRLEGEIGKNIVQDMLDLIAERVDGEVDSIVSSARSSASPGEAIGEIAAGMLDSMMLDPIISVMDEPVDPIMLLFGETPDITPAETPTHGDTLVLPQGNEFIEGPGKDAAAEEIREIEEEEARRRQELERHREELERQRGELRTVDEEEEARRRQELERHREELERQRGELRTIDEEEEARRRQELERHREELERQRGELRTIEEEKTRLAKLRQEDLEHQEAQDQEAKQLQEELQKQRDALKELEREREELNEIARQKIKHHEEQQHEAARMAAEADAQRKEIQRRRQQLEDLEAARDDSLARRMDEGELTSRSMGRLSATQSEIYRDVFNDAAVSLVADIFSESIPAAEENKRKAAAGLNIPQRDKGDDEWTLVSVQATNCTDVIAQNLSDDVLKKIIDSNALDEDEQRLIIQARAQAALIQEAARRAAASEDQDGSTATETDEWIRVAEENMRQALQLAQKALDVANGKDGRSEAQRQARKDSEDSQENHLAAQRITNDLLGQLLGAAAGSEASDAIDPMDVSEAGGGRDVEDLMVLVFDTLDYKTLNHTVFIDDLLSSLRGLGLAEKHASMLQIQLSPGSVVAEIFGPRMVRKHLEAVQIDLLDVMGCIPRKLMKAPPRPKQSRPVTSVSDVTVVSADSSHLLEAQANDLLSLWIDSPKSAASTSRSGFDSMARQMVNQYMVTPQESARQAITAAKAKSKVQEPCVIEDFSEEASDARRVAANATDTAIRAAPIQAVSEEASPVVEADTSRPVTADQPSVPYVIYATDIANNAVTNAAGVSECPTSVVLSEAGNSPHSQQNFEVFVRETLDRSTAAAAAESTDDVMPEATTLHPFASELAQEITQDALNTLETDAQQQADARQAQATQAGTEHRHAAEDEQQVHSGDAEQHQQHTPETAQQFLPDEPGTPVSVGATSYSLLCDSYAADAANRTLEGAVVASRQLEEQQVDTSKPTQRQETQPEQPTQPEETHLHQPTQPKEAQLHQPTEPAQPTQPEQPTQAQEAQLHQPTEPDQPTQPEQTTQAQEAQLHQPTEPDQPTQPEQTTQAKEAQLHQPTEPAQPTQPEQTTQPKEAQLHQPTEPAQPTQPEETTQPKEAQLHQPTEPAQLTQPEERTQEKEAQLHQPTQPAQPTQPEETTQPKEAQLHQPTEPAQPTQPEQPTQPKEAQSHQPTQPEQPPQLKETQSHQPTRLEQPTQPEGTQSHKPTQPEEQIEGPVSKDLGVEAPADDHVDLPGDEKTPVSVGVASQSLACMSYASDIATKAVDYAMASEEASDIMRPISAAVSDPAPDVVQEVAHEVVANLHNGPVETEDPPSPSALEGAGQQTDITNDDKRPSTPVSVGAASNSLVCDSCAADIAHRTMDYALSANQEATEQRAAEQGPAEPSQDDIRVVEEKPQPIQAVLVKPQPKTPVEPQEPRTPGSPESVGGTSNSIACDSYAADVANRTLDQTLVSEQSRDVERPTQPAQPTQSGPQPTKPAESAQPSQPTKPSEVKPSEQGQSTSPSKPPLIPAVQPVKPSGPSVNEPGTPGTPVSVGGTSNSVACDSCAADMATKALHHALVDNSRKAQGVQRTPDAQTFQPSSTTQTGPIDQGKNGAPNLALRQDTASCHDETVIAPADAELAKDLVAHAMGDAVAAEGTASDVHTLDAETISNVHPVGPLIKPGKSETEVGSRTPVSVGGASMSHACDAYAAAVASSSVDKVLSRMQASPEVRGGPWQTEPRHDGGQATGPGQDIQPTQPNQPTPNQPDQVTQPSQPTQPTQLPSLPTNGLERRDTGSVVSESVAQGGSIDLAHIVSSAVAEACREANLSLIASVNTDDVDEADPEQVVRQAVEEALRTELAQRVSGIHSKEAKETGSPLSIGGASVSAANDADVMALASKSVEHVLTAVRASQKPDAGSPASVSGVSNSAAHDADAAILASKSVEKVLMALQLPMADQENADHSVATDGPVMLQLGQLDPAEIARVAAEEAIRAEQIAREQAEDLAREGGIQKPKETQPQEVQRPDASVKKPPRQKEDRPPTEVSAGGTSVGHPVAAEAANRAVVVAIGGAADPSVNTVAGSDGTPQPGHPVGPPGVPTTISDVSNSLVHQMQADLGRIVSSAVAEAALDAENTVIAATSDAGSLAQVDTAQLANAVADEAIHAEEVAKKHPTGAEGKSGATTEQPARDPKPVSKAAATEPNQQQPHTREDQPPTEVSAGGTSVGHPVAAEAANRAVVVAIGGVADPSVNTVAGSDGTPQPGHPVGPPGVPTTISEVSNSLVHQTQADLGRIVSSALEQAAQEDIHTTVIAATSDSGNTVEQPTAAQLASAAADEAIRAVQGAQAVQAAGHEPLSPLSVDEAPADVPLASDLATRAVQLAVTGDGTGSDVHTLVAETASEIGQPGVTTVVDRAVEAAVTDRDAEAVSDVSHLPDSKAGIELIQDVLPKTIQAGGATVIVSEGSHATTATKDAQRMAQQAAEQAIRQAAQSEVPLSVIVSDGGASVPGDIPAADLHGTSSKGAEVTTQAHDTVHDATADQQGQRTEERKDPKEGSSFERAEASERQAQPAAPAQHDVGREATTITEVSHSIDPQSRADLGKLVSSAVAQATQDDTQTTVIAGTSDAGTLVRPHAAELAAAVAEEAIRAEQAAKEQQRGTQGQMGADMKQHPRESTDSHTAASKQRQATQQQAAQADAAASDQRPQDLPSRGQTEAQSSQAKSVQARAADSLPAPATVTDHMATSQTSMQGSHGASHTSFQVSHTTFQLTQSTLQASHTTFDPEEPTQSTDASLFNSTAPAVVGRGQGPVVPQLWNPHPRSDGFYGWEAARTPSDASDGSDHRDTLPTFVPADGDATLPANVGHWHWAHADPGAQTVKPTGFTARSGYSDDSIGRSPGPGQPIVNTSILSQLCNLLNAPDTPDSEVERVRRGPIRRMKTPEEQSPSWVDRGEPSAASPISPFQAETDTVTVVTSSPAKTAKTKRSVHSAARSADETLPSLPAEHQHDALPALPSQTLPMFQSDFKTHQRDRREQEVEQQQRRDDPFMERSTPRSQHERVDDEPSLVDPNLIEQLCHLLNAPDTPSSAAVGDVQRRAPSAQVPKAEAKQHSNSKATKPSHAEETLQRPLAQIHPTDDVSPGETLPMFQSGLRTPPTPPHERRERREREARRRDPFDRLDWDQDRDEQSPANEQSLVDPNLIAQLCRLLNQPETPPSDTERIRREPAPRRVKEDPGLLRRDPRLGDGESQPHTARTSIRSRGTASDQTGEADVNEALEEEVFNLMDMLCIQIEEPQA